MREEGIATKPPIQIQYRQTKKERQLKTTLWGNMETYSIGETRVKEHTDRVTCIHENKKTHMIAEY